MLTPDEIRVKEFLPALRGYDADEVRAFLHALADEMDRRAAEPAVDPEEDLGRRVTRLSEELELAIWTMRRLEAVVVRLEARLDSGAVTFLAS